VEFLFKNIIAISHFLTKTFIQLESTDPFTVAKVFISALMLFEDSLLNDTQENDLSKLDSTPEIIEDFNNDN
jgi:hypothetical protein